MNGERRSDGVVSVSTVRATLESVLSRDGDETIIEECRRCGTTVESAHIPCPACECDDIVEYRIE
ncbi:hypothetical protein CV102_19170 [Natronococcus pandeyae]|uniref:Small CPxCG-related zinc finger protein n=1 Tax=Natronococcus pandeyae TaxID=2055836 RepID=A0A8J8PYD9_9EURY|nr:hypothetical protein CV102_19170 [Natronococcus pandeyae]